MLQADNVAESLQGNSGKPKVPELPVTIQIGGIENDMIMNMSPVHMRRHNKRMLPLGESHTSFISYFICFLRCNLSGLKGLADLISNDISIWLSPRFFSDNLF